MSCGVVVLVPLDLWHLKVKLSLALKRITEHIHNLTFLSELKGRTFLTIIQKHLPITKKRWINSRVGRIDVVDRHSAFNASKCKTCRFVLLVLEYGNTAVLDGIRAGQYID